MRLYQRFQNLIVDNRFTGAKSLFSADLTRQLFADTAAPPSTVRDRSEPTVVQDSTSQTPVGYAGNQKNKQAATALKMERIRLASPILTFQSSSELNQPCKIECFPLVDRKMMWADHLGRPFLFDAKTRLMEILPIRHKPKSMPFSLFVPNADADNDYDNYRTGSSLFIMESIPKPECNCSMPWSDQFEVFVYRKPSVSSYFKSWQCQPLPSPPYIHEPKYLDRCSHHEISSYAVVDICNSLHICISVKGIGTYCLDTASYTWKKIGKWTLPFHGRVEYVPELKLWFGLTTKSGHLAAADLSTIDSQPKLVGNCKQLDMPEEWKECKDSQLVNLGSGRFCIARFFHSRTLNGGSGGHIDENIAVFTGVEVVQGVEYANAGSGEVELRMIPHKSLCHKSTCVTIDAVF